MNREEVQGVIKKLKQASLAAMVREDFALGEELASATELLTVWLQEGMQGEPPVSPEAALARAQDPDAPPLFAPQGQVNLEEEVAAFPPPAAWDVPTPASVEEFEAAINRIDQLQTEGVLSVVDEMGAETALEEMLRKVLHERYIFVNDQIQQMLEEFDRCFAAGDVDGALLFAEEMQALSEILNDGRDEEQYEKMKQLAERARRKAIDRKERKSKRQARVEATAPKKEQQPETVAPVRSEPKQTPEELETYAQVQDLVKAAQESLAGGEPNQALARLYEAQDQAKTLKADPELPLTIQMLLYQTMVLISGRQTETAQFVDGTSQPIYYLEAAMEEIRQQSQRLEKNGEELRNVAKKLENGQVNIKMPANYRKLLEQKTVGVPSAWVVALCVVFAVLGLFSGGGIVYLLRDRLFPVYVVGSTPASTVAAESEATPTDTRMVPTATSTKIVLPVSSVYPNAETNVFPIFPWQVIINSKLEFNEPPLLWIEPVNYAALFGVPLSLMDQTTGENTVGERGFPLLLPWTPQILTPADGSARAQYIWTRSAGDLVELPDGEYRILVSLRAIPDAMMEVMRIVIDNTVREEFVYMNAPTYSFRLYDMPFAFGDRFAQSTVLGEYGTNATIALYGKIAFVADPAQGVEEKVDGIYKNSMCFLSVSLPSQPPVWGWAYCYQVMNPNRSGGVFELPLLGPYLPLE